jgi:hypothetical protein
MSQKGGDKEHIIGSASLGGVVCHRKEETRSISLALPHLGELYVIERRRQGVYQWLCLIRGSCMS